MVFRMSAGRMVGRDDELGRLLTLLDDAEASHSVVALVSGDAGVGKSRLVAEVTQLAAGRGFTVLSGQCAELGDSVPYLPLADALRGAAQATGVRDALSSRPALSMLLPEGGGGPAIDSDRSGLARQQMFGGVLGLLASWGASFPADAWVRSMVARRLNVKLTESIFLFPWWLVLLTPLFATLVTTLAALLPARRAVAVNPVTALRYE